MVSGELRKELRYEPREECSDQYELSPEQSQGILDGLKERGVPVEEMDFRFADASNTAHVWLEVRSGPFRECVGVDKDTGEVVQDGGLWLPSWYFLLERLGSRNEPRYWIWTLPGLCVVEALRDPDGRYTKDFWRSLIAGIHEKLTHKPFEDEVYSSVESLVAGINQELENTP